jgi:hypothetical protein
MHRRKSLGWQNATARCARYGRARDLSRAARTGRAAHRAVRAPVAAAMAAPPHAAARGGGGGGATVSAAGAAAAAVEAALCGGAALADALAWLSGSAPVRRC